MNFYTVTELKQRATQIITELETTGKEVVITKNGKPVALITNIKGQDIFKIQKRGNEHGNEKERTL